MPISAVEDSAIEHGQTKQTLIFNDERDHSHEI